MAKATKRKTDNVVTMPRSDSPSRASNQSSVQVAESDIARRAFELYCERGCQDGYDVDDWLRAERELQGVASSTAA